MEQRNKNPNHGSKMELQGQGMRLLEDGEEDPPGETWELAYMIIVLFFMFVALISDRVGPDHVFITALAFAMAAEIVTVKEGLAGFANEGVLTVMALFVVAHGLTVTGAVDWYIGKLLGNPKTSAGAQLRLTIPVTIVSALLNNTPIVAVMIPIVLHWAKTIRVSASQLLIPLSYAAILGGTLTLIGTSSNWVIAGLLQDKYPNEEIQLFDITPYGVPFAIIGVAYIIAVGPFLLPGGRSGHDGSPFDGDEILLGARVTSWSPSAGRSVKRSGLRDTGGLYLVSVRRAATGNIHRAVGQEFVLNVGDVVYFSGLIDGFGEFCHEHGLEIVTNESSVNETVATTEARSTTNDDAPLTLTVDEDKSTTNDDAPMTQTADIVHVTFNSDEIGLTKESLALSDEAESLRSINLITDVIQGLESVESMTLHNDKPVQVVVATESRSSRLVVLIGVNAPDRPGLLLDISKGLLRLNLQLHHTEAAVRGERSVSVWRCSYSENTETDAEEIRAVLSVLLEDNSRLGGFKKRGLKVIRARVTKHSRLVGHTAAEVQFRETYKAAIVAVQQGGRNATKSLSSLKFEVDDILVLQVSNDCPLLSPPRVTKSSNSKSLMTSMSARFKGSDQLGANETILRDTTERPDVEVGSCRDDAVVSSAVAGEHHNDEAAEAVRRDLKVVSTGTESTGTTPESKEFLVAMQISPHSNLSKKTIAENGISNVPGVYVVCIERPVAHGNVQREGVTVISMHSSVSIENQLQNDSRMYDAIDPDEPLQDGDILWFAGSASAVGDLRKIPGLVSPEQGEIKQMNENVHNRRLIQAVVAKSGPLVGKTVRELGFRTRYGAAVISVHREGHRIHEHPGNIKLHAGDVLLLEAGPTFLKRTANDNNAFALLAEVKDSAPPRLRYLIPAVIVLVAMLVVSSLKYASLLVCAIFAAVVMVMMGLLSEQETRDSMDWPLYIAIAAAFGISTALTNSGVAKAVANFLITIGEAVGIGDAGLFGAVYFATTLISAFVTNNAAAALMFPIAMGAAEGAGINVKQMSYAVMLGASDFSTPFGYQTNLMVYGPGGYKTIDYLKFGFPLQIVLWIVSTLVLSVTSVEWYVSWVVAFIILVIVAVVRLTNGAVFNRLKVLGRIMMSRTTSIRGKLSAASFCP